MTFIGSILRSVTSFGTKRVGDGTTTNVNPTGVSYTDPIEDKYSGSQSRAGQILRGLTTMYLVGFTLNYCPSLFFMGLGAFLFGNDGHTSFHDSLSGMIMGSDMAMERLAQKKAAAAAASETGEADGTKKPGETGEVDGTKKPGETGEVDGTKKPDETGEVDGTKKPGETGEVDGTKKPGETERELTPLEKAEARCTRAEEQIKKLESDLERSTKAAKVAQEKADLAKKKLDQAKLEYESATSEAAKATAKEKLDKAQMTYNRRSVEAGVTREKVDVVRAKLDEANVKLTQYKQAYSELQGEEVVDVSDVPTDDKKS